MQPERICTLFFSPTGTSRKTATAVARGIAAPFAATADSTATADSSGSTDPANHAAEANRVAAAFVGEHSYSTERTPIAAGRPDGQDLAAAEAFGRAVRRKLAGQGPLPVDAARLKAPGTPLVPLLRFIRFVLAYRRRQKKHPVVLLPAGSAARCIRCCACVKGCPVGARTFETPFAAALSRNFARRKPPVTLL